MEYVIDGVSIDFLSMVRVDNTCVGARLCDRSIGHVTSPFINRISWSRPYLRIARARRRNSLCSSSEQHRTREKGTRQCYS